MNTAFEPAPVEVLEIVSEFPFALTPSIVKLSAPCIRNMVLRPVFAVSVRAAPPAGETVTDE
jgi:hypothetical protein